MVPSHGFRSQIFFLDRIRLLREAKPLILHYEHESRVIKSFNGVSPDVSAERGIDCFSFGVLLRDVFRRSRTGAYHLMAELDGPESRRDFHGDRMEVDMAW